MKVLISRHNKKYNEWKNAVFERDLYKCKNCQNDKNLCAHHIVEWSKNKELRYEISNGISLCKACHAKEHWKQENFGMRFKNHSKESKIKMSIAKVGKEPPNKGKKFTIKTRLKMRHAKLGKKRAPFSDETLSKMSEVRIGKKLRPHSDETKKKMSAANKEYWTGKESLYLGKTWYKCEKTGKRIWNI